MSDTPPLSGGSNLNNSTCGVEKKKSAAPAVSETICTVFEVSDNRGVSFICIHSAAAVAAALLCFVVTVVISLFVT